MKSCLLFALAVLLLLIAGAFVKDEALIPAVITGGSGLLIFLIGAVVNHTEHMRRK